MPLIGPADVWTERWWHALGSDAHCQLAGPEPLADDAATLVEQLEQCWSRFRPSSELCRLNADPSHTVGVSPTLVAALHRALLAWELTDGWFDPTVLPSMETAGYDSSFRLDGARRGDLASCGPAPGADMVSVDLERMTVSRPPGLRFDLGGIGKGLAADIVTSVLVDRGAGSVCLSLGGDVRVAGSPPSGGWSIPVERPDGTEASISPIWFDAAIEHGAIVTSTTRFRRWTTLDGGSAHHLIDPRTGMPSTSELHTVVVAGGEAWWAEVLAKAALLAGPLEGRRLLERHGVTGWMAGGTAVDVISPASEDVPSETDRSRVPA